MLRPPFPCQKSHLISALSFRRSISFRNDSLQGRLHSATTRRIAIGLLTAGCTVYAAWRFAPNLQTQPDATLGLDHFICANIIGSEDSGPNHKLITLQLPDTTLPWRSSRSTIWSLYIKDDDIQVERPYTPLNLTKSGQLTFWIKRYPSGEVGRWLHTKRVGDRVEVRGPHPTWSGNYHQWKRVILISGGTGIAPFHQILHKIFDSDLSSQIPSFSLLHATKSIDELPPSLILDDLKTWAEDQRCKLSVYFFMDTMDSAAIRQMSYQEGRINRETILHEVYNGTAKLSETLFLVCGPESMVISVAGPRSRGNSQGPIGGILGSMGCTSDQVYKL